MKSSPYSTSRRSLILVAPAGATLKQFNGSITDSDYSYQQLIAELQRLRGFVYLKDGAINASDLTSDGRHVSSVDEESWHLLTMSADRRVLGCARFHQHANSVSFQQLAVRRSAIAQSPEWGAKFRASICAELAMARQSGFSFVELGGWALAEELRGTTEALQYVLATFAWTRLMGGARGITTATERNGSASILRRLGGQSLESEGEPIPPYYDRHYNCGMEVLRFDSRYPNPKYEATIELLRSQIASSCVVRREPLNPRGSLTDSSEGASFVSRLKDGAIAALGV